MGLLDTAAGGNAASLAIGATASGIQNLIALIGAIGGNNKLKKLFKQRTAFQTPSEVLDILNSTEQRAQSGYDPQTLDFLTNQADRSFATSTGNALRLGADPNVIAGLDDQYLQNIMKIGSDNATLQLQNFDKFLNAKQLVAANKEAEWASKENLIKDEMAAASTKVAAGQQNLQSGINLGLQVATSGAMNDLYGLNTPTSNVGNNFGNGNSGVMQPGLSPSELIKLKQLLQ